MTRSPINLTIPASLRPILAESSRHPGARHLSLAAGIGDDDTPELRVFDVVGDPTISADNTLQGAMDFLAANKGKSLRVLINSPGGLAFEGVAIHNMLTEHDGEVVTRNIGLAGSAASVILMAGTRVEMHSTASLFIHRASGLTIGNRDHHAEMAEFLDHLDGIIAELYARRAGKRKDSMLNLMRGKPGGDGTTLTADEAKELGLIDRIIATKRREPAPAASTPLHGIAAMMPVAARKERVAERLADLDRKEAATRPKPPPVVPSRDIYSHAFAGWLRAAHDPLGDDDRGIVMPEQRGALAAIGYREGAAALAIPLFGAIGKRRPYAAMTTADAPGLTGDEFVRAIEVAMLHHGGILSVATIIPDSQGGPLHQPTANDTANAGRQIGEGQSVSVVSPTFGRISWGEYKFTSDAIKAPYELLRDGPETLATELGKLLGIRLARVLAHKLTWGSGANEPRGLMTSIRQTATAEHSDQVTFDDLLNLEHTLSPGYRALPGCGWMMSDGAYLSLRTQKDGEGRYLIAKDTETGVESIRGFPFVVSAELDAPESGKTSIIFGQLPSYRVRLIGPLRLYRLTEAFRHEDSDGFVAYQSADGALVDAGAGDANVVGLTHP